MKTLLPITPAPATAPAAEAGPRDQASTPKESFASVLDRQTAAAPAGTPAAASCSPAAAPVEKAPVADEEGAIPLDEQPVTPGDEQIDVAALFTAGLGPVPPLQPPTAPEPPRFAITLEGTVAEDVADTTSAAGNASASTRDSLHAAIPTFRGTVAPGWLPPAPLDATTSSDAPVDPQAAVPVEFSSLQAIAARGGEELPVFAQSFPTALPIVSPDAAENPALFAAHASSTEPQLAEAAAALESSAPFPGLSVVPTGSGTPAAKRGGAMQNIAFPTSDEPLPANSAESAKRVDFTGQEVVTSTGSATTFQRTGEKPQQPAATTPPLRETRPGRVPRETVAASDLRRMEAIAAAPLRATREAAVEVAAPVQETSATRAAVPHAETAFAEPIPGVPPVGSRPEQIVLEPVKSSREPVRPEVVQVIERTIDAALRLRASGQERLEVAVQLESGDRLTIQLRLANGEVTPVIRTSSDGLRTALEQNWNQFTDRAGERGVRLTPPVFDMDRSNSNMSDLSQQRHGREQAHADAQPELFPNLPRRMHAPRPLSSTAFESSRAAAEGVRAYA